MRSLHVARHLAWTLSAAAACTGGGPADGPARQSAADARTTNEPPKTAAEPPSPTRVRQCNRVCHRIASCRPQLPWVDMARHTVPTDTCVANCTGGEFPPSDEELACWAEADCGLLAGLSGSDLGEACLEDRIIPPDRSSHMVLDVKRKSLRRIAASCAALKESTAPEGADEVEPASQSDRAAIGAALGGALDGLAVRGITSGCRLALRDALQRVADECSGARPVSDPSWIDEVGAWACNTPPQLEALLADLEASGASPPPVGWASVTQVGAASPGPPLAHSRLGGQPRLWAEAEWPRYRDRPMAFLGQLDFAEIASVLPESILPEHGGVAFFAYFDTPEGDHNADYLFCFPRDRFRAVTIDDAVADDLVPRAFPDDLPQSLRFAERPLGLRPFATVRDSTSPELRRLGWNSTSKAAFERLEEANTRDPGALVLGHPMPVQWDVRMDWEGCDEEPRRIFDQSVLEQARRVRPWKNLLSFDTEAFLPRLGYGTMYIGIRREDLERGDFHRARMVLQGT